MAGRLELLSKAHLLDGINTPEDLRKLPEEDLPELCEQLRAYLLDVVSGIGGHLSSSLGSVELTVALHYALDTPKDQIVWDVGHQAYIHKVLTGRRESLKTIRQYGGISGFTKRSESPSDCYGAGHASTALSAAYGIAVGRDIRKEEFRVAAVFGDGALTGGLCYEAFNNAGNSSRRLLAVLNDNKMSISPNVGAINNYLTNFATTNLYQSFRARVRDGLESIPRFGKSMSLLARRIEESAKGVITPGALFEALGFNYFGPFDGHDVVALVGLIRNLRDLDRTVLLHVLTQKGKGYGPAEDEPENYHGVKPFCQDDGIVPSIPGEPSYQEIFGQTLTKMASEDDRIVAITAAMTTGTGLTSFAEAHPDRFFDVGIAEEHAVVFACGMATRGLKPVCAIYSTFLQRAYDQVVHDAALQHLPVVFCMDRAGFAGEDGPTHHGTFDISYLRHIPGMVLAAPSDGNDLADLLATAAVYDAGPFAIRYPKGTTKKFDPGRRGSNLPIGSWEVKLEGKGTMILAVGPMVDVALKAVESLDPATRPEVVNCRFIKPLDAAYLSEKVPRFNEIVTIEENALAGGFGSAILEWIEDAGLKVPVRRMGIPDEFVTHGSRGQLLEEVGLTAGALASLIADGAQKRGGRSSRPRAVK